MLILLLSKISWLRQSWILLMCWWECSLGNYIVSLGKENEGEPWGQMHPQSQVQEILLGPVFPILQSSYMQSLPCWCLYGWVKYLSLFLNHQQHICTITQIGIKDHSLCQPLTCTITLRTGFDIICICLWVCSAGAYLVKIKDVKLPVILKILTETNILLHTDEEIFLFRARLSMMLHEIHILMMIPPHLNIVAWTIASALNVLSPDSKPSSLAWQIWWTNQMVFAIYHLHHVANAYHGDIKFNNIVLSTDDDGVFIDFKQVCHAEGWIMGCRFQYPCCQDWYWSPSPLYYSLFKGRCSSGTVRGYSSP